MRVIRRKSRQKKNCDGVAVFGRGLRISKRGQFGGKPIVCCAFFTEGDHYEKTGNSFLQPMLAAFRPADAKRA
jgi:hypothetical protein